MPHLIFVRKPYVSGHQVVPITEPQKWRAAYVITYINSYANTLKTATAPAEQELQPAWSITALNYS